MDVVVEVNSRCGSQRWIVDVLVVVISGCGNRGG